MATTLNNDEIKIKPAEVSKKCEIMLDEAFAYIVENSLKQAEIMISQFEEIRHSVQERYEKDKTR